MLPNESKRSNCICVQDFSTRPGSWHTMRWQIDDAQFVNYWGYNFSLESHGDQYNKYYLQSVTVTKREGGR